ACRSCQPNLPSMNDCPSTGYGCNVEWPFTANVLTPDYNCRCSEAKCAGNAKLAVHRSIVTGMRCNNSQWMANGEVAE
ncbi:hypothetical protein PMAYCL1PPCAC_11057, partial [Pristionchus mayeri]